MAINPTQEQSEALGNLLRDAMSSCLFEVGDAFDSADAAVESWQKRSESGNFFSGSQVTTVLLVAEGYCGESPEELIRRQF